MWTIRVLPHRRNSCHRSCSCSGCFVVSLWTFLGRACGCARAQTSAQASLVLSRRPSSQGPRLSPRGHVGGRPCMATKVSGSPGFRFCLIWKTVDLGSRGKGDPAASPGLGGTAWGRKGLGEKGAMALGGPAAVLTPSHLGDP